MLAKDEPAACTVDGGLNVRKRDKHPRTRPPTETLPESGRESRTVKIIVCDLMILTVAAPMPPLAPVTRIGLFSKPLMLKVPSRRIKLVS